MTLHTAEDLIGVEAMPHLVTTSCTECGAAVEVPEEAAEQSERGISPVVCDGCGSHDCLDGEADHLTVGAPDPNLPPHIVPYRCQTCGQRWEFNVRDAEHRRAD